MIGGADRDRTDDLRLAKPALSQLSYSPGQIGVGYLPPNDFAPAWLTSKMVGLGRVELPTSPLSGVRSNQLSYRPAPYALKLVSFVRTTGPVVHGRLTPVPQN